jgi:hypothetical protein
MQTLTGKEGSLGSMDDSSRNAEGSKNNLNHSHRVVPGIGLVFLASKPQAMTRPCSSYKRQVGICCHVSLSGVKQAHGTDFSECF